MKQLEDPIELYSTTFTHIYFVSGFSLSKEVTSDGKEYIPPKTHGCMQSGYWCEKQIKEDPVSIAIYLKVNGIRNPKTVIKAIKKYI